MRVCVYAALVTAALVAIPAFAQERQKKLGSEDFHEVVATSTKAFEAKEYGECVTHLKNAISIVASLLREAVLDAMPPPPEGFTSTPSKKAEFNPFLSGATGLGQSIEQRYRKSDGAGSIQIQVLANSPMVATLEMAFKMAAMSPETELVKYGAHKALFKKERGTKLVLQVIIGDKHYVDVNATGIDEDGLFKMINQDFVDKIASLLG